ncbi:hypothetical protein [Mycobacterium sp. NPDC050853]|uniref:hypothetical protein n=1 Tax=Mycobacterium sp. NPDC050853 TaxID=3155160 RepID=UPI0033EF3924
MTTPPQPPSEGEQPQQYPYSHYPYGPGGYPPPPGYPQYPSGYYPYGQPPPKKSGGAVLGMTFAGVFLFWVMTFGTWMLLASVMSTSSSVESGATVLAVVMSVIGLGGGLAMTVWGRDWFRGLGIGFLIGWATVAITTGFVVGCISMLEGLE